MDEFDRAGAIEEGEAVAHIIDAGDIGLDAHRMGARLGAGIADAGAFAHRTLARRAAAARQNGFQKAGFAALKGADQRDQPRPRNSSIACFRGADHDDPPNFRRWARPSAGGQGPLGRSRLQVWRPDARRQLAAARAAATRSVAIRR